VDRALPAETVPEIAIFSNGGNGGDMTWFATGLGACGITNNANDMIAAASYLLFDSFGGGDGGNPNKAPICNKRVSLTIPGANQSIALTITDRCAGCEKCGSMDLTTGAFSQLADLSVGRITGMTWTWVPDQSL